jgi:hypothetical protein
VSLNWTHSLLTPSTKNVSPPITNVERALLICGVINGLFYNSPESYKKRKTKEYLTSGIQTEDLSNAL